MDTKQAIVFKPRLKPDAMFCARIFYAFVCLAAFLPAFNPARLSGMISKNLSLFTCAVSYSSISSVFIRALSAGWVSPAAVTLTYTGALVGFIGMLFIGGALCASFGNNKLQRLSAITAGSGGIIGIAGMVILSIAHGIFENAARLERIDPIMPFGIYLFFVLYGLCILLSVVFLIKLPKPAPGDRCHMEPKYRLFLMILPFLVLVVLFAYLPLWGWRYAFFDYRAGFDLTADDFVGFKWFTYLFSNAATRNDIIRVLRNTFVMSGLNIATSWLPMAFAIFLSEIRSNKSKRIVQTFTTIPNFISWVLVYSVAFAIFSTEGFLNWMLLNLGIIESGTNWLMSGANTWLKMWAWGTWKGLGWSAIIYIASIASIEQEQYEAATVDGAGRFAKMWYITVPGLMSTFFVLLLLSIANVLSNGLDQYLVFYTPVNRDQIQVLDLYVYQIGIADGGTTSIPLATVVGMFKSIISVILLFVANSASKHIRGESIV